MKRKNLSDKISTARARNSRALPEWEARKPFSQGVSK